MERDPDKMRLLEGFRATLSRRHTVAKFEDPGGLAVQVAADLSRTVQALEDSIRAREEEPAPREAPVADEIARLVGDTIESGLTEAAVLSAVRHSLASLLGSEGRRRPLVFLSHSAVDKPIVREVATGLREAGVDVWFDEDDMRFGARIVDEIERGLNAADFMAYFISKNSMDSKWSKVELDAMMVVPSTGSAVYQAETPPPLPAELP